jgi:tripartite-type tricarboxylate transporter receptor subunit TctC
VSTARRSSLLPEVPPIADSSLAGFDVTFWVGLWAPAATPIDVLEQISGAVARALGLEDLRERLFKLGAEPMSMSPEQFDAFVWFEETRAVSPLPAERPQGVPDTYPFGV